MAQNSAVSTISNVDTITNVDRVDPAIRFDTAASLSTAQAIDAPLIPRLLAAVVDYFTVSALMFFLASQVGYSDFQFLIPLIIGGLYFTTGNSSVTGGQTLGKRVFGLRVLSLSNSNQVSAPLELARSFLRFLFSFGILIVVAEVPPLIYRYLEISTSTYVLELHMLVALLLSLSSIGLVLISQHRRALHDYLAGSIVVRLPSLSASDVVSIPKTAPLNRGALLGVLCLTSLLASLLWSLGSVHQEDVKGINRNRYLLEAHLPIRLLSVSKLGPSLELFAIVLPSATDSFDVLGRKTADFFLEQGSIPDQSDVTLSMRFIAPHLPEREQQEANITISLAELN